MPDFNSIYDELSKLTLAVYAPLTYVHESRADRYGELYDTETATNRLRQTDREASIKALMRVNLLKRLESSVEAFRLTLARLSAVHHDTLKAIAAFERGGRGGFAQAFKVEGDGEEDEDRPGGLERGQVEVAFADMDLISYKRDLAADVALIDGLLGEMRKVTPAHDEKLQHLMRLVERKAREPINSGNAKLLIFTAFADTAEYLYRELAPALADAGRPTALVTGSGNPKCTLGQGFDFSAVLTLFSPVSKKKAMIARLQDQPQDIDVLIATDCISEGQNLQDCDMVVNYDIHWNPVRIIQRFGRVDCESACNVDPCGV